MMWDDYEHMHGGIAWVGGWVMLAVMFLFLAALAVIAVALARAASRSSRARRPRAGAATTAERTLEERFARGELDEEDYRRRRDLLR